MKHTVHHYMPVIVTVANVEAESMEAAIEASSSAATEFADRFFNTEAKGGVEVLGSQFADGHLGALVDIDGDEEYLKTRYIGSEEAQSFVPQAKGQPENSVESVGKTSVEESPAKSGQCQHGDHFYELVSFRRDGKEKFGLVCWEKADGPNYKVDVDTMRSWTELGQVMAELLNIHCEENVTVAPPFTGCRACGCTDVELAAWVHANTNTISADEGPSSGAWCPQCEDDDARTVYVDALKPYEAAKSE